ncbi:16S rRNA (cytidine1402-2'-O)-methyltransferase [Chitinophaga costaii]|uniref:Ribosomal RNA small subunit methyltransferase I n=1 Tax=Chitinophaga costaii TaxID=1335309 RepID=A0A1C4BY04_9BACT|nr:16S rRNA (cytidine(1402)-2'-O)-methyltransferase [Chitinophaga costaii]PUZ27429.1 16S rRNA (cytidine(1402)-2'-O)-methyltransferase [Chitinophaga costaii]SCC11652.1 16S rRNA (cytidine1402-2'-O)-methyltransferase [Chitinophaga costaii]
MKLFLIPSPIGNLADITYRAVKVLEASSLILAEDTRTSGILLKHYNIQTPMTAYHQHNEHKVLQHLVQQLQSGKQMALLTDAGTPGVSDPGFLLVRECVRAGIPVECLPGATAFVPALVNSGIPMNRFSFEGFLPLKKGRHTLLTQLSTDERTMVFYESPMRLLKTLDDFIQYFGPDRQVCVSRELTKMFEENKRGSLQEVRDYFQEKGVKGEIVIVLAGKD